jgi:hypothetical protein
VGARSGVAIRTRWCTAFEDQLRVRTRGAGWGRRRPGRAAGHWNDRCHAWNRITAPCRARARSRRRTKGSDTTEPFIGFNLLRQLIDREGGVRYYSICRTMENLAGLLAAHH